jgi:hypothetical protein
LIGCSIVHFLSIDSEDVRIRTIRRDAFYRESMIQKLLAVVIAVLLGIGTGADARSGKTAPAVIRLETPYRASMSSVVRPRSPPTTPTRGPSALYPTSKDQGFMLGIFKRTDFPPSRPMSPERRSPSRTM